MTDLEFGWFIGSDKKLDFQVMGNNAIEFYNL